LNRVEAAKVEYYLFDGGLNYPRFRVEC
jgi:hypothetical protein